MVSISAVLQDGGRKGRMREGGRPRVYSVDTLEALASKPVVKRWREGLAESSRKHALYCLNRYVIWLKKNGLNADPEAWIAECQNGTVRTLTSHVQTLQDWLKSAEFEGASVETYKKAWFRIRGLFEANMVPLPAVKLRITGNGSRQVRIETTAFEFLEMVRKVLTAGRLTLRDRSIILTVLQSGMDASTAGSIFNRVGFPQLVNHFGTEDFRTWN